MSPSQRISSFTPSNTNPEILERIFVQRQRMLSKLVKRLERGIAKGNKHHILLIGPRGSGKTHFITLVQHRLLQNTHLMDKVRIAWLGEDTVYTGLIDLALEISEQLANAYPTEFNRDVRRKAPDFYSCPAGAMLWKVAGIDFVKRCKVLLHVR